MKIHLDYETYSEVDIKKVGLYKYAEHPSTEVVLTALAIDHGEVWQTEDEKEAFRKLKGLAQNPEAIFYAFNAPFERIITLIVLGLNIPLTRWRCAMVEAYAKGFTGGLDAIGQQLGLAEDKKKVAHGKRLVLKFCKPAPRNHKAARYTKENSPEDWRDYKEYNRMDVIAEREIDLLCGDAMSEDDWLLWHLDQHINDLGLPVDPYLITQVLKVYHQEKRHLMTQLQKVTGLANPNSRDQMLKWLVDRGYPERDLKAETVTAVLKNGVELREDVTQVLGFRQSLARTAASKWEAFSRMRDTVDNRVRGVFQFYGASRTGRWAGRGVQPHNLHRSPPDQDRKVESLLSGDALWVRILEDNVMDCVASTIRAAITAPPGKKLVVCDLASIESRVLGWMAECQRIQGIYANGLDTYRDFASRWFNVPYEVVSKEMRTLAKPPELGCGYQLSAGGLKTYAEGMGIDIGGKLCKQAVSLWRHLNPEVVSMWQWLVDATKYVIQTGESQSGYKLVIWRDMDFLKIRLPSGRDLYYQYPGIETRNFISIDPETGERHPFTTQAVVYMGLNPLNHQWQRVSTHGGKITENADQAIARDVLAHGIGLAHQEPLLTVIGHVHDEIICLADEANAEAALKRLQALMSIAPKWAPGLTLDAAGYIANRYRKE